MATHKHSPLRDRLLSNSPDPIRSSILRGSGMGWASSVASPMASTSSSVTSPLRIAKRDSPVFQQAIGVTRRSSSSFRHVRSNNLVTNSPFKMQPAAPATPSRPISVVFPTRRVSGEKRPRPSSMHEDAETENERPFSLKRDRKQSKTFQGLLEKEPVTRSPFKQLGRGSNSDEAPSSPSLPIPKLSLLTNLTPVATIVSRLSPVGSDHPGPTSGPSPARSSLVSRRLLGPRLSGGGKRDRRKTVTFDERCDVVEFDRETSEEEYWEESDDGGRYGEPLQDAEEGDPFFCGDEIVYDLPQSEPRARPAPDVAMDEDFYESCTTSESDRSTTTRAILDPDTSITGLVEEMFFSPNAALISADNLEASTLPRVTDIPTDTGTKDSDPFEHIHHADYLLHHHQQGFLKCSQPPSNLSPRVSPQPSHTPTHNSPRPTGESSLSYPFGIGLSARTSPGTSGSSPCVPPILAESTPPSSRTTQSERAGKKQEEDDQLDKTGVDVGNPPMSPSPTEIVSTPTRNEGRIPKHKWPRGSQHVERHSPSVGADALEPHQCNFEEYPNTSNGSMDPNNLSIGHSEVSLSGLDRSGTHHSNDEGPQESTLDQSSFLGSQKDQFDSFDASREPHEDEEVLAGINDDSSRRSSEFPSHTNSPSVPVTSPLNLSQNNNSPRTVSPRPHMRHRISKEDIKRRLTERRTTLSPSPEPMSRFDSVMERFEYPTSETLMAGAGRDASRQNVVSQVEAGAEILERDKERDRMSIFSSLTDVSTETATVQCAEKLNVSSGLPTPDSLSERESGSLSASPSLNLNFDNMFSLEGIDLSRSNSTAPVKDNLDIPAHSREIDTGSVHSGTSVKVGDVDVNMDMKSALDRLMDDVAGVGGHEEDSLSTEEGDRSLNQSVEVPQPKIRRAATDSDLLHMSDVPSRTVSADSAASGLPPLPPPKDNNIKAREQLILEKRREARRVAEGDFVPVRSKGQRLQSQLGLGRPSRRRSMSADDAHDLAKRQLLSVGGDMEKLVEEDLLSQSIERELRKLDNNGNGTGKKSKYHVREREGTIYASASDDKVSHMPGAGDLETGKAWRTVRRPSDMNEYSKQIKEYRSQANPTKAYGKIFVRVLNIQGVHLPLPQQSTALTCTLNNGIHFVTTPECELSPDCRIDQEFELIEHSKLEFTLTLKIRRDPHIVAQFKALTLAPVSAPPPPPPVQQSSSRGMRAFFSSSPKKQLKEKVAHPPPPLPVHRLPENLARYLKPDGTLARAFIQFKDIATRCDTRLFETSYPLIGQRVELGNKFSTLQVGEIVLQMFRLPPLPGVPPDQLPQSLEECHRGLRHINWHKVTYFEGILTQNGGDCNTWRRRLFRVIGASLVAFNDVTRKATATIDLKKAIAVHDDQDMRNPLSPHFQSGGCDDDVLFGVERSFRLVFSQEQEIVFFADTDEEKSRWLEVFRALVGHIPPHPLWAELLWQRQEEASKTNR